jgi:hypothetical protein
VPGLLAQGCDGRKLAALGITVIASSVPVLGPTLMDETNAAVIARLDRATQGGFNRSSQHFEYAALVGIRRGFRPVFSSQGSFGA